MLAEAQSPADFAPSLEQGHIVHFARCPFPLPSEDEQKFLREQLSPFLRMKNVSWYPHGDKLTGLQAPAPVADRARSILSAHARRVRDYLEAAMPEFTRGWQAGTSSFRTVEEKGRGLSSHASNQPIHVDAGAYGATHGDRILRFFVNLNPERARVWISKGNFAELWFRHGAESGVLPGPLAPSLPERALAGALKAARRV